MAELRGQGVGQRGKSTNHYMTAEWESKESGRELSQPTTTWWQSWVRGQGVLPWVRGQRGKPTNYRAICYMRTRAVLPGLCSGTILCVTTESSRLSGTSLCVSRARSGETTSPTHSSSTSSTATSTTSCRGYETSGQSQRATTSAPVWWPSRICRRNIRWDAA